MKRILAFISLPIFLLLINFNKASAHISYVLDDNEFTENIGGDPSFLTNSLFSFKFILITISVLVVVFILGLIFYKTKAIKKYVAHVLQKLNSYHEFIPWISRLALGISLIGAGVGQVLISPTLDNMGAYAGIQTLLGFFLLAGFALVPTIIATIILFFIALSKNFYLIGNLDFLGLALAVLVFHSARPGVDDILEISWMRFIKIPRKHLAVLVRVSVGIAMMFLALYEKILNPHLSEMVVYKYNLTSVINVEPAMWVLGAGIVEFVLGLIIFFGLYTRLASVISLFVLSLTFFYFKEAVYAHVTLFSILTVVAIEGGGRLSFDNLLKSKHILPEI